MSHAALPRARLRTGGDRSKMPARVSATPGPSSPTAAPGAPLLLGRWALPYVLSRFFREILLFVGDEAQVALGLHRFHDPADELPAVFLRRLLEEALDVFTDDRHA